jgi:hypothetical protein
MKMKAALKILLLGLLLIPMTAQAEYRRIELTVFGMD